MGAFREPFTSLSPRVSNKGTRSPPPAPKESSYAPRSRILRPAIALSRSPACWLLVPTTTPVPVARPPTRLVARDQPDPGEGSSPLTSRSLSRLGCSPFRSLVPDEDAVSLEAGRYRLSLGDTLSFDVDLPPGTEASNGGLYLVADETILKVEAAGEDYGVPSEPCTGVTDITPRARRSTTWSARSASSRSTAPVAPSRSRSAAPLASTSGCGSRRRTTPRRAHGQVGLPGNPGSNNNMSPGYVGHWWFLDVDGQRVVAQTFCEQCDAIASESATRMVQSITFTPTP